MRIFNKGLMGVNTSVYIQGKTVKPLLTLILLG